MMPSGFPRSNKTSSNTCGASTRSKGRGASSGNLPRPVKASILCEHPSPHDNSPHCEVRDLNRGLCAHCARSMQRVHAWAVIGGPPPGGNLHAQCDASSQWSRTTLGCSPCVQYLIWLCTVTNVDLQHAHLCCVRREAPRKEEAGPGAQCGAGCARLWTGAAQRCKAAWLTCSLRYRGNG